MGLDVTALSVKVVSEGITKTTADLKQFADASSKAEKNVDSLAAAMKKIDSAYSAASSASTAYMTKLREQAALMQGMAANSRTAAGSTEALAAAMALLSTSLNLLNQNTQNAERTQRRHNESMQEAHALARGLSGSLGALWMTYGNLAGMAVGVAIGASLKGIVTVGKDVEHTLEGIRVRGNETVESVDKIRESVMELGKGVYGPQAVAHAFETLVLAGLNAEQAVSSITAALNLATVGGVSIEKAATTLVSVGTAIGFTAEGFGRVGDVIAKTAALSMSSVETLSEAFKSASSVNRLYGVSLEDIGTSLGVLSNLGIQGSAAGTALKNFYKELASESPKVVETLKQIGVSQKDLKDSSGNFKPLLDVVSTLDAGLKKLNENEQKLAQSRTSNERGQRLYTQLLGEYNTTLSDGSNALQRFRDNVENSYGFAAKGAVQMSLTAKSQIDSMFNTLKTSFAETFTSVKPEIMAFSARMKEAFSSKEFKDGLVTLAQAFAKLAVAIVDNLPLLAKFTVGLLAVKAAMMGAAVYEAAAAGIKAISLAIAALEAGTLSLAVAFPPLLIILATATAAWVAYNLAKGDDPQKQARDAEAYASGYISGLVKEAENLDKVNQKMRERKTIAQANAEIERDESRQKMVMQDNKAITEAENNLQKVMSSFSFNRTKQIAEQTAAQQALDNARMKATNNVKLAEAAEASLFAKAKENADLAKAQADAARKQDQKDPTAHLSGKIDTAGINDAYHAAIKLQEGYIADSNKAMAGYEKQQNAMFKAGEQSKLETLQNIGAAQLATSIKNIGFLNKEYEIAASRKDGKSDMQGIQNKMLLETQTILDSQKQMVLDSDVYLRGVRQAAQKLEIKEAEEKGQWVRAAQLRFEGDTKAMYEEAKKAAKLYGDEFPILIQYEKQLKATQDAAMDSAKIKEAAHSFDALAGAAANLFKGMVADNQGLGIAGIFTAAQKASEDFANQLPELEKKLAAVKALADIEAAKPEGERNPNAAKAYNEELSKMQGLANHQKTMWAEVGEAISKSLGDAFGNAGKSVGKLMLTMSQYENTKEKISKSDKTTAEKAVALDQARIHSYGDMAGAAKGFFNENTKGYKAMQAAEQVFRMFELAMTAEVMMKKLFASSAIATAETTANQIKMMDAEAQSGEIIALAMAEGEAKALAGIAGQASGDPYTAWARMAMMAAAMAALGFAVGGGGGGSADLSKSRQESAGTGTVLGDEKAKSDSLNKSLSILEKNSGLGLVHSQSMVNSLKIVADNIGSVTGNLARTTGILSSKTQGVTEGSPGFFGSLFGGKSTSVADKGIQFVDPMESFGRGLAELVGTTFKGAEELTLGNLKEMGIKAKSYVDVTTSSFWSGSSTSRRPTDLSDEQNKQFELVIQGMANSVGEAAKVLGMGGEAFAARMEAFKIKIEDISGKGLTGAEFEKQVEAVFSALGDKMASWGLPEIMDANLAKAGEGMLETLMRITSDFTTVSDVFTRLGTFMNVTGIDAIKLSENLINAAGGVDKLSEGTNFLIDNFFTEAEKMAPIVTSVENEMARLGFSSTKTVEQFDALIHAQDLNTVEGQNNYVALINVASGFKQAADYADALAEGTVTLTKAQQKAKDIADKTTELNIALLRAQGNEQAAVNMEREIELATLEKLDPALAAMQKQINTVNDTAVITDKQKSLELALLRAQGKEQEALTKERQAEITELNKLSPALGKLQSQLNSLADAARMKDIGTSAFNTLATDVERLDAARTKISTVFKGLSMAIPADTDTFLSVLNKAINKANAGVDLAAAQPAFEKALKDKVSMPKSVVDVFKGLDTAVPTTLKQFTEIRDKFVGMTDSSINVVTKLNSVTDAFKTVDDAATKAAKDAKDTTDKATKQTEDDAKKVADALASINDGYQKQIDALIKASLSFSELRAYETAGMDASTIVLYNQLVALQAVADGKKQELTLYNLTHTAAEQLTHQRELEMRAMNTALIPMQLLIYAAEDLNAVNSQRADQEQTLQELLGNSNAARAKEMSTIYDANQDIQRHIYLLKDADAGVTKAMSLVERSISAEKTRIQDAADAQVLALRTSIDDSKTATDNAKQAVDDVKSIFDDITAAVKTLRGNIDSQVSLIQARAYIDMALVLARAGTLPNADKLKDALSVITTDKNDMYSSNSEFVYAQMVQAGKLEEIGNLVGGQKSIAEQQLESLTTANTLLEDQIKAIEKSTTDQIKVLDNQLQAAQDAVNVLRGVDISVRSVEAAVFTLKIAMDNFASEQAAAKKALPQQAVSEAGWLLPTSPSSSYSYAQAVSGGYNGVESTNSMPAPIASAVQATQPILPTQEAAGNIAIRLAAVAGNDLVNSLATVPELYAAAHQYGLPGFSDGINVTPHDMIAQLHEGEAVVPKKYNPFIPGANNSSSGSTQSNAELLAELRMLREEVKTLRDNVVVGNDSTRQLARQFDQVTSGGNTMLTAVA